MLLQLAPLLIVLVFAVFWFWMFRDMSNNDQILNDPNAGFTWPPTSKNSWTTAFIVFNIFAAVYYYVYVYRYE